MHFGKNNPRNKYYIEEEDGNKLELVITEVEKDLGIMIMMEILCCPLPVTVISKRVAR